MEIWFVDDFPFQIVWFLGLAAYFEGGNTVDFQESQNNHLEWC